MQLIEIVGIPVALLTRPKARSIVWNHFFHNKTTKDKTCRTCESTNIYYRGFCLDCYAGDIRTKYENKSAVLQQPSFNEIYQYFVDKFYKDFPNTDNGNITEIKVDTTVYLYGLLQTNSFNVSVRDILKKHFPHAKITVDTNIKDVQFVIGEKSQ